MIFNGCFWKDFFYRSNRKLSSTMFFATAQGELRIYFRKITKGSTSLQVLKRCLLLPTPPTLPSLVFSLQLLRKTSSQIFPRNKITDWIHCKTIKVASRLWSKIGVLCGTYNVELRLGFFLGVLIEYAYYYFLKNNTAYCFLHNLQVKDNVL